MSHNRTIVIQTFAAPRSKQGQVVAGPPGAVGAWVFETDRVAGGMRPKSGGGSPYRRRAVRLLRRPELHTAA